MSKVSPFPSSNGGGGGGYNNLKEFTRYRLLQEMLGSCQTGDSESTWKVLITDELTVKIVSCVCKLADTTAEGVSLVEAIEKERQPFPFMDAIYFIQPSWRNIILFLSDMSSRKPLYRKAFVFFSSPISKYLLNIIKKNEYVLTRISALREINLEYLAIDTQGFVTNNDSALELLYGDEEDSRNGVACLNQMAARVATEFPFVRYRAAKSFDATTMTTFSDLIPTKLAAGIWDCLMRYKETIPNFPAKETCELLILDRSVDQIAPIIHEWTYDAMCHDLLNLDGNKYVHEIPSKTGGSPEKKHVLLDDRDPIWLEFRHAHIGVVSEWLHEKAINFVKENKTAQFDHSRYSQAELSTRELKQIAQALPQYVEQRDKLALHQEIASRIYTIMADLGLQKLAQLEQDLVFGDAGIKDVIKYLTRKDDTTGENKLRLLMILAAIHPEIFEGMEGQKLMKLAKLPPGDMKAVENMKLFGFGGSSYRNKSSSGTFSLKFDIQKKKHSARKERPSEETLRFSRFYPMIEELVENLSKGELSKEDYPYLNDPGPTLNQTLVAHSMRSRRTPTWALPQNSDNGISRARHASTDLKKMGQRIFVVIVGGATRSELRVCHKLTAKLKREVILGSSSLIDPATFITKLKMNDDATHELLLDDLQI
ncbi:hypothetical protein M0R45_009694 [Rubus argutus]|uniref:SNARE-interacting protein KEULE n=1 Tax=Rubus argutus TaxID=59490 RepID=A0AAW1Y5J5_RUBAR